MYIAKHFELPPERVAELLASAATAQLVTAHAWGPEATLLPMSYQPDAAGGLGSLHFHVTRTNPVWKTERLGEALAIVSGPDAYVSPTWEPGFAEAPGVPTWNYETVHAYGDLVIHDDPAWAREAVTRLSAQHGYDVAQVSERTMDLLLRSVVGVELKIARVLAKGKLSQNRPSASIEAMIEALRERGLDDDEALAEVMEDVSLPHAKARESLVDGIRAEHNLGFAAPHSTD